MEKNDECVGSISIVEAKSVPAAGGFRCTSSDLKKASMAEKHESHENHDNHEKNNSSSNTEDNHISNNNNVDEENRDDIGCVHYKRRAKFVVSTSAILNTHIKLHTAILI